LGGIKTKTFAELIYEKNKEDEAVIGEKIVEDIPTGLPKNLKIHPRRDRHRLRYSIPRR
jgi:hypothetical protein